MKTDRRYFLGGLLASGLVPKPTWADAGAPAYLAAAAKPDGSFALCGITDGFDIAFEITLPSRGHAAAAHPTRPEAVAFARRPGTYALVIDCVTGNQKARLSSPEGRHFYGHGVFSQDGNWLFTTENDYEVGRGLIGIWDVPNGYKRAGEFSSGGIGPHDIKRLPDTDTLVVANGGIDTHPESGRAKLNIPTMQPNLSYITAGKISESMSLSSKMHKNSIRHLAVSENGDVAFGMQWQGEAEVTSLVGLHRMGAEAILFEAPKQQVRAMNGYIGSIAFAKDAKTIAVTSPRGGLIQTFNTLSHTIVASSAITDVCGVAPHDRGYAITSGTGQIGNLIGRHQNLKKSAAYQWDNHLILI